MLKAKKFFVSPQKRLVGSSLRIVVEPGLCVCVCESKTSRRARHQKRKTKNAHASAISSVNSQPSIRFNIACDTDRCKSNHTHTHTLTHAGGLVGESSHQESRQRMMVEFVAYVSLSDHLP